MWLKLTQFDGKPVRVNMDNVASYCTHDSDGGKTFLEYPVSSDNMTGIHVQESIEQIDGALRDYIMDVSQVPDKPKSSGW